MRGVRSVGRVGGAIFLSLGALVLVPGVASAHEVGGSRFAAPLPLPLLYVGAGATVALTALWLGAADSPLSGTGGRRLVSVPSSIATGVALAARTAFLAAVTAAIVAGFVGRQVAAENVATVFVWPVWIKGVALIAILVGSPWRLLSPWRTVYDALVRLEGREIAVLGDYPRRLAEWPALFGFAVGIGVVENLTVLPRSPRGTAIVVASYGFAMIAGAVAFGPIWFRRADPLKVLYRLFGRVSPFEWRRTESGGYRVGLGLPWRGSVRPLRSVALAVFVVAAVYTVSFDGFTGTPEYQTALFAARDLTGLGPVASAGLYAAGLVGFALAFVLVAALTRVAAVAPAESPSETVRSLAPTVIPIAAAYELAHNYPFVVENLGRLAGIVGEAAVGADPAIEPLARLSLPAFWGSQVALIVGGHVLAVVAAHAVLRGRYGAGRRAVRAHLPLTLLMVGYTVLSLWLVSRPVVA